MKAVRGRWSVVLGALVGVVLGAVGGAMYSASESKPKSAFASNGPSQPRPATSGFGNVVDPVLVLDGAVCGFVLGAAAGAIAKRRATAA